MTPSSSSTSGASGAGTSKKKYRGVSEKYTGLWATRVHVPNFAETRVKDFHNPIYIGGYDSSEKAARAYDAASLCIFGSKPDVLLRLNFPDAPPQIPLYPEGQVLTVSEVKKEANRHANNIEPIQVAQDMQEQSNEKEVESEEANHGIAKDKLPPPVSERPAGKPFHNFMHPSESATVPEVLNHTVVSPVSPCPAEKPFYNFLGVEESPPVPEVLSNAEQENDDSSP